MPLLASDVKIPMDLSSVFSGIGGKAKGAIGDAYNRAKTRQGQEISARGLPSGTNSYAPERFTAQEGLDTGALEAGLGGALGDTGYKDTLAERDYQQNLQLAEATADAMKPSLLQQVFAGLGGGSAAAGQYAALRNMMPKSTPKTQSTSYGWDAISSPYSDIG